MEVGNILYIPQHSLPSEYLPMGCCNSVLGHLDGVSLCLYSDAAELSWRYQYCQYIVILGSSQFNTANIPHTLHNLYTAGHYTEWGDRENMWWGISKFFLSMPFVCTV